MYVKYNQTDTWFLGTDTDTDICDSQRSNIDIVRLY